MEKIRIILISLDQIETELKSITVSEMSDVATEWPKLSASILDALLLVNRTMDILHTVEASKAKLL